ncbi:hypothetical protein CPB84DRAFT_1745703 [Gymnopilus junonius]|uniref:Uncharacterized protein n=1 Tax=Gymnopilus junonius TaxID=109634 RepID=A0A9P5NUS3_GYMJU|nr:hypothetical protein CPB84DRAFT_1745703 [Gymnopilus junonius]
MPYLLTLVLALLLSAFSAVADYFGKGLVVVHTICHDMLHSKSRALYSKTLGDQRHFSTILGIPSIGKTEVAVGRGGDIGSYNHTTYNHIVMNGVGIDAIHNISVQMATIETRVRELENRVRELRVIKDLEE